MSRRNHHKWDREQVQPGSSEWPSTRHSTVIAEDDEVRPASTISKHLRRELPLGNVIVVLVLFLAVGGLGVHLLAHFLRS
jgi:hypothetical protein